MRTLQPLAVAFAALLALTACGTGTPSGEQTPLGPVDDGPTGTPTPTPQAEDGPTVTVLPADCLTLVSQADPTTFTDAAPLNHEAFGVPVSGVVTPSAPADGANPIQVMRAIAELHCLWRDPAADVTGLLVEAGHATPEISESLQAALTADGYSCTSANGGTQCSSSAPVEQFPGVTTDTSYLFRDDLVIAVTQSNYPTNNLMGSMAAEIWG